MPASHVEITGFGEVLDALRAIEGAVQRALVAGGRRLGQEATAFWRSLVTKRSGQMARGLVVDVRPEDRGGGVTVYFIVSPPAFYYTFQPQAEQWTAQLVTFLRERGEQVLGEALRAELARTL